MITATVNMCCAHDVVLCELCTCYNGKHEGNLDYSTLLNHSLNLVSSLLSTYTVSAACTWAAHTHTVSAACTWAAHTHSQRSMHMGCTHTVSAAYTWAAHIHNQRSIHMGCTHTQSAQHAHGLHTHTHTQNTYMSYIVSLLSTQILSTYYKQHRVHV